ncbi:hypothetical protein [Deefgea rivuli]|uniref:hypothetical protein n=1 Tax=Deefgea rivuli TaxID=400948 RepID=UPI001B8088D9|nr:hypothetical protein [Deefgea rivuli]
MKTLTLSTFALLIVGSAQAAISTMNYACPTGIELHIEQGGRAYLNGKDAKLKIVNENYFEVRGNGVSVEVGSNPDGSRIVSYTGKHGANGMCSEVDAPKSTAQPAAKKTMPKNMGSYCSGEAAGQLNTKPKYIQTEKASVTSAGYAIKGSADLGQQGKKSFQCDFDPSGQLQRFQVL